MSQYIQHGYVWIILGMQMFDVAGFHLKWSSRQVDDVQSFGMGLKAP